MQSFLTAVATDLYKRYGDEVSRLNIVFPSRRARLFFTEALTKLIDCPLWQPTYLAIEDLVQKVSPLKKADSYGLLIDLYKFYVKYRQSAETFDHFYFWGEILLNDFDTIDKYLVNAEMLFKNLAAQKALEGDFSFLSEEQVEYIRLFWSSFDPKGESELQRQFIEIWSVLSPIYSDFKAHLYTKGVAYDGMIYRDMAQRLSNDKMSVFEDNTYVFIGFNALNECEKTLFRYLRNLKQADFYWDYDEYYMRDRMQEAGYFMRANMREFPVPESFDIESIFNNNKDITITSVPSDVLQAKIIPSLLASANMSLDSKTAIVLADENLLLPVLYSLPEDVEDVNITMGYPLKQTPVYSLAELLIRLQKGCKATDKSTRFYYKDVLAVLNHQYLKLLVAKESEELKNDIINTNKVYVNGNLFANNKYLKLIFVIADNYSAMTDYLLNVFGIIAQLHTLDSGDENALRREYIYYFRKTLNQLKKSIDAGATAIGMPVFLSLLRSVFSTLRIPFTGEPIKGLQIMGLLETRTLDFENLVVLSLNEGILPHAGSMPSFVPYHLRIGFNMPAVEQQEAIYAYYFYRLLQRAKNVQLVYSSKADEVRTGEMSRYLYQLKFESGHEIKEQSLAYQLNFEETQPITIDKTDEVMRVLKKYWGETPDRTLSPSAISSYIKCPLQFYFKYVASIAETEEVQEELAANVFGSILHNVMEHLYKPYLNKVLDRDNIMKMLSDEAEIYRLLDEGFAHEFYHSDALPADFKENGKLLITRDVIAKYVRGILLFDARNSPFTPVNFEERVTHIHSFPLNNEVIKIKLSGFADRIDHFNGAVRIIDYKTGGGKGKEKRMKFKNVDSLFSADPNERNSEAFQTFLYALMYAGSYSNKAAIMPALYFVRDMYDPDFSACLIDESTKEMVKDFTPYASDFTLLLNSCVANLFDSNVPFTQTIFTDICLRSCAFSAICRRK